MLTRNWYNCFKVWRMSVSIPHGYRDTSGNMKDAAQGNSSYMPGALSLKTSSISDGPTDTGIMFGSGTTPATFDDYKLESQITSGLTGSVVVSADEDYDPVYTVTLTNGSENDITIGEVGILQSVYGPGGGSTIYAMVERTVLDAPITIPAGGVGIVTYSIKLNVPEA